MMYSTMTKPSKNMLMTPGQIYEMEQREAAARARTVVDEAAVSDYAEGLTIRDNRNSLYESDLSSANRINQRNANLNNIKSGLLAEALLTIYERSCPDDLSESSKIIGKNAIASFIKEQGVGNLLTRFRTRNLVLSEVSRITNKYYDHILEHGECETECEFIVDGETDEDFHAELADMDTEEVDQMIKTRVTDSVSDFIDGNLSDKLDYEDMIQSVQDRIGSDEEITEEAATELINMTRRKINESRISKDKNIFRYMVEKLGEAAYKNDSMKQKYVTESGLRVNVLVEDAKAMYTMLEMINSLRMVDDPFTYVKNYIESL